MEQRRIPNVFIDEKSEFNLANNFVTFKDVEEVMHSSKQPNWKKMCITPFQKLECWMSCNMYQHRVKHDYQFLKCVSSILCNFASCMVDNLTIDSWILSGMRSFKGNTNMYGLASLICFLLISPTMSSLVKIGFLATLGRWLEKETLWLLVKAIGEGNL